MCGLLVAEVTWHNTGLGMRVLLGVAITRLPQGQTRLDGSNGHWAVHTRSLNRILCVDCPWRTMPTREKSVVDLDWGGRGGNSYQRRRRRRRRRSTILTTTVLTTTTIAATRQLWAQNRAAGAWGGRASASHPRGFRIAASRERYGALVRIPLLGAVGATGLGAALNLSY